MITKEQVVKAVNERLALVTVNQRFDEREHEAPVFHAIIAVLCDAMNSELEELRKLIDTSSLDKRAISKCGRADCEGCKADR